jgi:hypothetical protein
MFPAMERKKEKTDQAGHDDEEAVLLCGAVFFYRGLNRAWVVQHVQPARVF